MKYPFKKNDDLELCVINCDLFNGVAHFGIIRIKTNDSVNKEKKVVQIFGIN